MRTTEIIHIVKRYTEKLKEANFPFSRIYLFGSQIKKSTHEWSDIDVAVISDKVTHGSEKYQLLLWKLRREIDKRIEPHAFTKSEFEDLNDPMVYEIRTTGIRIA